VAKTVFDNGCITVSARYVQNTAAFRQAWKKTKAASCSFANGARGGNASAI